MKSYSLSPLKNVNVSLSVTWLSTMEESLLQSKVLDGQELWPAPTSVQPLTDLAAPPIILQWPAIPGQWTLSHVLELLASRGQMNHKNNPQTPADKLYVTCVFSQQATWASRALNTISQFLLRASFESSSMKSLSDNTGILFSTCFPLTHLTLQRTEIFSDPDYISMVFLTTFLCPLPQVQKDNLGLKRAEVALLGGERASLWNSHPLKSTFLSYLSLTSEGPISHFFLLSIMLFPHHSFHNLWSWKLLRNAAFKDCSQRVIVTLVSPPSWLGASQKHQFP